MLTIADIRRCYPDPWVSQDSRRAQTKQLCYCVGGAILLVEGHTMVHGVAELFPEPTTLAASLQRLRPALTEAQALDYASVITETNDAGDFDTAWGLAEQALRGPQG